MILIKPDDIIKLAEEFNLLKNKYTNSITLSMPIINHNVPDVFDFRRTNGTYDLIFLNKSHLFRTIPFL